MEMTQESGELFKNKHMWMGFAISGTLTLMAGLHYLYPSIPCIRIVRQDVGQFITEPPWNAMGGISMAFYFWAIGIAFLMPLELSVSCWMFYWMTKLELVGCADERDQPAYSARRGVRPRLSVPDEPVLRRLSRVLRDEHVVQQALSGARVPHGVYWNQGRG